MMLLELEGLSVQEKCEKVYFRGEYLLGLDEVGLKIAEGYLKHVAKFKMGYL